MSCRMSLCLLGLLLGLATVSFAIQPEAYEAEKAAQAYRAKGEPVQAAPDGTFFCEAEEFQVTTPTKAEQPRNVGALGAPQGWQAKPWGENYYSCTFANTFLSRKGFLGAPEQVTKPVTATLNINVTQAGKYLVLARYEACYRFETQFRIRIEQKRKVVFDRLYGARDNVKIWAFGQKLQKEVCWSWGADENMVWEGYSGEGKSTYATLQPGPAKITLIAAKQPEPAAKRNVDLIMLTQDEKQVQDRVNTEGYLPLDGWLTQANDVWLRVSNTGPATTTVASMSFTGGPFQQHSPYWVHTRNWKPVSFTVEPGHTSDWVEVGSTMDTLNDGQWGFTASGPCTLTFGVKAADGTIATIREFTNVNGPLPVIGDANVRYTKRVRTPQEATNALVDYLKAIPMQGKTPVMTSIHVGSGIRGALQPIYQFKSLQPTASLGDEIALPAPDAKAAGEGFIAYLKAQGLTPAQVDADAGDDWAKVVYNTKLDEKKPGVYYWSMRYFYHYGIQAQNAITDDKRRNNPQLLVGANYSPQHGASEHSYLGEVFKWVSCFREGGMTMPWSEDYIWGMPMGTPQMNEISVDLFRAGMRHNPDGKIMMYVMPHSPGNLPEMWKRMWYTAMGHGTKIFNLFEFDPVWAAYTENHVNDPAMYGMVLKTMREYGTFEDIVQTGGVRPSQVGIWFSETGDIWHDNAGSFAAAKRALYISILHQQLPLDVVVEQDALDGTLDGYKVLYLTDAHVSQAASTKIADWVRNGGQLFATAGAGMFDEYNRPNIALRGLLGVEQKELLAPKEATVGYIKEDLPFAPTIDTVKVGNIAFPVYGAVSRIFPAPTASVAAAFQDGSPAIVVQSTGKGQAIYCAFLPGLSYFKPAIPKKPVDRGNTPESMAHFLPVKFDGNVGQLVGSIAPVEVRPVELNAPLVEASVIQAKGGTAIALTNWTTAPVKGLKVTVNIPVPTKDVSLSTGKPVTMETVNGKPVFTLDLEVADTLILR